VLIFAGPLEAAAPPLALLAGFLLIGTFMVPIYMYIHWDFLLKQNWLLNPHFFALLAIALGCAWLAYRYPDMLERDSSLDTASH
jgi:hypothetical protein